MTDPLLRNGTLSFLAGGGEMGQFTRAFDWTTTPLGAPETWPQGLKTGVRLLLSTQHPMFIWWGPELIQFYNDAYRHSIGPERHPVALGQRGRDCWAEIWGIIGPQIERVMDARGSTWNENHLVPITRNGQREDVYWTYSYSPLDELTAPNGVGGVLVVCAETTQMVLTERRNAAERERLAQMFAQAPGFVAMLQGPEHRFQLANAAYIKLIGHRDVLGKTVAEALPGSLAQGYVDLLDEVYRTGRAYNAIGTRYVTEPEPGLPTQERYLDFVYQPITDATGCVSGIFVEGADVTERIESEMALRTLNETLEQRVVEALTQHQILTDVVEASETFIQVLDLDYRILAVNKANADAFERVYGVRPKVGDDLIALLAQHPAHQQQVKAHWDRALAGEEFTFIEPFGDLDQVLYEAKFNVLRNREGRQIGASNIAVDITQRLQDQARLLEAEERAHQAKKIEALGQLTGGVAHDFNNLLMVLSGGLDMIDRQGDPARREGILTGMRQAVERGTGLSRQLLAFARRQPLSPAPVDLAQQIDGMRELLDRSLRGNIHFQVAFDPDLWPVEVDPGELELAILNLAINARDAMPDGGTITAAADNQPALSDDGLSGDFVRLSITDTGTGMSPDVVARVFEPFFTTKDVGKGSGLGLAQVHGFAHASGGAARIASTPGAGTTVSLLLPRTHGVPVARGRQRSGSSQAHVATGVALVVEDDDAVAAVTVEMFQQLGYRTARVANAHAALATLAGAQVFDLVFSDVMMPGAMNGVDLALEIRQRYPDLPVVLASGYIEVAKRKIKQEAITLLPKPFRLDDLASTLAAARVADTRVGAAP